MSTFDVQPIKGESYGKRQWGWMVWRLPSDGESFEPYPFLHATMGGTGACWNLETADDHRSNDAVPIHVCELEEFIFALQALCDSEADRLNRAHWE